MLWLCLPLGAVVSGIDGCRKGVEHAVALYHQIAHHSPICSRSGVQNHPAAIASGLRKHLGSLRHHAISIAPPGAIQEHSVSTQGARARKPTAAACHRPGKSSQHLAVRLARSCLRATTASPLCITVAPLPPPPSPHQTSSSPTPPHPSPLTQTAAQAAPASLPPAATSHTAVASLPASSAPAAAPASQSRLPPPPPQRTSRAAQRSSTRTP